MSIATISRSAKRSRAYRSGHEDGIAWAKARTKGRTAELRRLRAFAESTDVEEWSQLDPWRGWSHWTALAAIIAGINDVPNSLVDWDDVEVAAAKLMAEVFGRSVGPDPEVDGRYVLGFVVGSLVV